MSAGSLSGKVAFITGASRGIGAAAAHAFAGAGAAVVLTARGAEDLDKVAEEIRSGGGEALAVIADAADPDATGRAMQTAVSRYGRLDVAFNNAGANLAFGPFADIGLEAYDATIAATQRSCFAAMQREIAAMLASGGGAIVNNASTAALTSARGIAAYAAAKHAVVGMTKTAALDYATQGIRVNAIAPGPIRTSGMARASDEQLANVRAAVPMRRLGEPAEVAQVALWLCTDAASYVTGAVLTVDGGRTAGSA